MSRHTLLLLAAIAASVCGTSRTAFGQSLTPAVPFNLQVPQGNVAFLKADAVGTQNYVCLPTGNSLAWKFQAPQATLFFAYRWGRHEMRQQIATHFLSPDPLETGTPARPTWQSSVDTSAVWAMKIEESSDPNYVAPGAIPWFLLQATGAQPGPTGGRMLAQTTFVQRVNTTGGATPTTACTAAGQIEFVPYTAVYIFYRAAESD